MGNAKKYFLSFMILCSLPTLGADEDTAKTDLYSLSREELREVPDSALLNAMEALKKQNEDEAQLLKEFQNAHTAMCKALLNLGKQCLGQTYLYAPSKDDLGCGEPQTAKQLRIEAKNLKGYRFRIRANEKYVSSEFGEGSSILTFQRDDGYAVTPPRLRQILNMDLISVTSNSQVTKDGYIQKLQTIADKDRATLVQSMQILLTLDGKPLFSENGGWLPVSAPQDTSVYSELRISPESILLMAKDEKCLLTPEQARALNPSSLGGVK